MNRSLPEMLDDEIQRSSSPEEDSGFGALSTERGCLPLKALDVQTRIDGLIARTVLTQTFVNAHAEALEATYIFPLPDRAAVTQFRLEVAGRIVEGELKERGAAREEYDQAIRKGHRAAITEEERPGVFTMRVGNLPPGEEATVRLTLTGPLPYSDGEATFRFPLVVAPRYIPGTPLPGTSVGDGVAPDTDAVPDASRISPPVFLPGFPNPVRLGLSVEVPLSSLQPSHFRSSLHTIIESEDNDTRLFRLQPGERLNRDFLLRFRIGQDRLVTSLSLQPDRDGPEGTFLLTLIPPLAKSGQRTCRDVVFVLDRSGSMSGWKIVAARRALARMVDTLGENDRFTVYAFDDRIETPREFGGDRLVSATNRLRFRAVEFLARIDPRGGTEMAQPLNRAVNELSRDRDANRERILVLVTDGQVGNEDQILKNLGQRLQGIRVFTLGIDRAVNAAFLRRLADLGGGRSELVESEDRLDEVMDSVHRHIGTPVLTALRLEPAGLKFVPESVVPARLPDLFAGTPLLVSGRYRGDADGAIALQARDASGQMWSAEVRGRRVDNPALPAVWARGRLREMEDRYVVGTRNPAALEREIVAISLRFGVLCRFTAFVAVDRSEVVNPGGQVHGIVQPVEEPAGWAPALSAPCVSSMRMRRLASPAAPASPPPRLDARPALPCPPTAACGPRKHAEIPPELLNRGGDAPAKAEEIHRDLGASVGREERPASPHRRGVPGVVGRQERHKQRSVRSGKRERNMLHKLLNFFRRGDSDEQQNSTRLSDGKPLPDVRKLLAAIQNATATNAAARVAVLRGLLAELEQLFQALDAVAKDDAAVVKLGEVLEGLRQVLGQRRPRAAAVLESWTQLEQCLQHWLTQMETTEAPQGEGFWK